MTATSKRQISADELCFAMPCIASLRPPDLEAVVLLLKDLPWAVVTFRALAQSFEPLLCLSHDPLQLVQVVRA